MKKLNCLNLFLLLSTVLFLTSCGDDYYTDDFLRNSDEKLCGYTWIEEEIYMNESGNPELCVHMLYFNRGASGMGSGKETFEYYRALSGGDWANTPYRDENYRFDWKWIDNFEGLTLDFGDTVVLFENVWVREYYLSGKYDGLNSTFYRE